MQFDCHRSISGVACCAFCNEAYECFVRWLDLICIRIIRAVFQFSKCWETDELQWNRHEFKQSSFNTPTASIDFFNWHLLIVFACCLFYYHLVEKKAIATFPTCWDFSLICLNEEIFSAFLSFSWAFVSNSNQL